MSLPPPFVYGGSLAWGGSHVSSDRKQSGAASLRSEVWERLPSARQGLPREENLSVIHQNFTNRIQYPEP